MRHGMISDADHAELELMLAIDPVAWSRRLGYLLEHGSEEIGEHYLEHEE